MEKPMPITTVTSDAVALTLRVVGDYNVPVERLWHAWSDPRQIERFWGPPTWPATFSRHDMAVGGQSHYTMTGPDGTQSSGYWHIQAVEEGRVLEVVDGFTADGEPNPDMPSMRMRITFDPTDGGSRFRCVTTFHSAEAIEQLLGMGMMEGMQAALGQMDDVLGDLTTFAREASTLSQLLDDTRVRISRVIRGSAAQLWRAHNDPALMQGWLLGPDGWTMPVCELAANIGESYTYEWESGDGSVRFGFTGELVASHEPYRIVTTERMIGMDGPSTLNELTFTPTEGGTLLTLVITYPTKELRDEILATRSATDRESRTGDTYRTEAGQLTVCRGLRQRPPISWRYRADHPGASRDRRTPRHEGQRRSVPHRARRELFRIGHAVAMVSDGAASIKQIIRLVGVYDADSTVRGELAYWVGARLGRRNCSLCDITHNSVRQRPGWKACQAGLPVPFDTFHRNDQPESIRSAFGAQAPVVVAELHGGFVLLLTPEDLHKCKGSTDLFVEALERKADSFGLTWTSAAV